MKIECFEKCNMANKRKAMRFSFMKYVESFDFCTMEEKEHLYHMLKAAFKWGSSV